MELFFFSCVCCTFRASLMGASGRAFFFFLCLLYFSGTFKGGRRVKFFFLFLAFVVLFGQV